MCHFAETLACVTSTCHFHVSAARWTDETFLCRFADFVPTESMKLIVDPFARIETFNVKDIAFGRNREVYPRRAGFVIRYLPTGNRVEPLYVQFIRYGKRDLIHRTLRKVALMLRTTEREVVIFILLPRIHTDRRGSIAGNQSSPSFNAGETADRRRPHAALHRWEQAPRYTPKKARFVR